MAKLSSLRAADSDRERAAERLRHATAEGRLSASELEERLEALFAARTYGELDAPLADLAVSRSPQRRARWAGAISAALGLALLGRLALMRRHGTDPGAFVAASVVELSWAFVGTSRSPLGADALEGYVTVAAGFIEGELPPRQTASRLVPMGTSGRA